MLNVFDKESKKVNYEDFIKDFPPDFYSGEIPYYILGIKHSLYNEKINCIETMRIEKNKSNEYECNYFIGTNYNYTVLLDTFDINEFIAIRNYNRDADPAYLYVIDLPLDIQSIVKKAYWKKFRDNIEL